MATLVKILALFFIFARGMALENNDPRINICHRNQIQEIGPREHPNSSLSDPGFDWRRIDVCWNMIHENLSSLIILWDSNFTFTKDEMANRKILENHFSLIKGAHARVMLLKFQDYYARVSEFSKLYVEVYDRKFKLFFMRQMHSLADAIEELVGKIRAKSASLAQADELKMLLPDWIQKGAPRLETAFVNMGQYETKFGVNAPRFECYYALGFNGTNEYVKSIPEKLDWYYNAIGGRMHNILPAAVHKANQLKGCATLNGFVQDVLFRIYSDVFWNQTCDGSVKNDEIGMAGHNTLLEHWFKVLWNNIATAFSRCSETQGRNTAEIHAG